MSNTNGKVGLRWRPGNGGKAQSVVLPLPWESKSQGKAQILVNQIAKEIHSGRHDTLRGALEAAQGLSDTMRQTTNWRGAATGLRQSLMESRNEIKPQTWKTNYEPYIEEALHLLESDKAITNGHLLLKATLAKWAGKPPSRDACCIAIRNLTDHAISRHHAATCWKIDASSIRELKGKKPKSRIKATLEDKELLFLINGIQERNNRWANVLRLLALYGLRPIELQHLIAKPRQDGTPGLWCNYQKVCGSSLTDSRWLEPCPLTDETGEVQRWNIAEDMAANTLELPIGQDGKPRSLDGHYVESFLVKQKEWRELKELYKTRGEWLRPYTFRDSYSLRCHRHGIEIGAIAQAMGHSVAVHSSSYRWASTETTTAAFDRAFSKTAIS